MPFRSSYKAKTSSVIEEDTHNNNDDTSLKKSSSLSLREVKIASFSAISGFLFGYDLCIVVTTLSLITTDLDLSLAASQSIVGSLMFAAVVGALVAGPLADVIGRKKTIGLASAFFFIGGLIMGTAPTYIVLLSGRIITGLAVGASGPTVSIYIAEIASDATRGALVTINEVMLCTGCLVSVVINYGFSEPGGDWRWMLGLTAVPAFIQLVGICFLPESPVYKKQLRRNKKKKNVNRMDIIRLGISIGIAVCQSCTAASAVLYYSHTILTTSSSKNSDKTALDVEVAVAVAKFVGVVATMFLVDVLGRKKLLIGGTMVMILCHIIFAIAFLNNFSDSSTIVTTLIVFILAWNVSWAPLMWVCCTEVLTERFRSIGLGITLATFWLSSAVVNQTFLSLFNTIGLSLTFVSYAVASTFCLLFVLYVVPETNGLSFTEIDSMLTAKYEKRTTSSLAYSHVASPEELEESEENSNI